jgi:ArsR family transcriptional regulator
MATPVRPEIAEKLSAKQVQAISRVLADPRRFQILRQIASQACSPCSELRECFPITAPTMSHHLKELEGVGLVETRRRGKFVDMVFCRETWNAYLAELKKI